MVEVYTVFYCVLVFFSTDSGRNESINLRLVSICLKVSPVPVVFTFILLVPLSTVIFSKQCRVMTTNGYDIVNIIQISIILMYPVVGRDWDIPMKLTQRDIKTEPPPVQCSNLLCCQHQKQSCIDFNDHL